jgi:hypothetical protein
MLLDKELNSHFKSGYFAYDLLCVFHSVLQYGIVFWGNSAMHIKYLNYKKEWLE